MHVYAIPFSEDLPNPGIEPGSSTLQADSLPSEYRQMLNYTGAAHSTAKKAWGDWTR